MEEKQHPVYRLYRALYDLNHPVKQRWVLRLCVRWHAGTLPFPAFVLDVGGLSEEDIETALNHYTERGSEVGRLMRFIQTCLRRPLLVGAPGDEHPFEWASDFKRAVPIAREIQRGGYGDALLAAAAVLGALRDVEGDAAREEIRTMMAEVDAHGGHDWEIRLLRVAVRQLQSDAVACKGRFRTLSFAHRSLTDQHRSERRHAMGYVQKTMALEGELKQCRERLDGCEEYNRVMRSSLPRH
jgi:hypothetical protein